MQLLIEDDEGSRSVVPHLPDEVTIGRKEDNQIRLGERNVSRHHARLVRSNGRLYIEDVEARYGIQKNGQKIDDRAEFNEGDVVLIGDYRLTLRPETGPEAESPEEVEGANETEIDAKLGEPDEEAPAGEPEPEPASVSGPPAELVVVSSNMAGREFTLDREEMVAGRAPDCDIQIDHRSVSSKHAKFVREGADDYKVVDLNSKNGVQVNGEQYKTVHLEGGDEVSLGHVQLRFVAPGEDFTFRPEDETTATGPAPGGSSMNPVVLGGAAVGVVVLGVVGFMVFGGGSGGGGGTPTKKKQQKQAKAAAAKKKEQETNKKVAESIEQARTDIQKGKLDKAIGALESLSNILDPTEKQSQTISKLLSEARSERPFKRRFDAAKSALNKDDYETALEKIGKIPEHSVFYDLARDEEMLTEALDGLLEAAREKLSNEKWDAARELASKVESYKPRESEAEKLLSTINEAAEKARKKRLAQKKQQRQAEENSGGGGGGGGSQPDEGADDSGGSGGGGGGGGPPVPDNPKKVFQNATRKWIQGKHEAAISECKKALRAGYRPCYRVIGMANKDLGNKSAACRNFKTYLQGNPSDASKIRTEMDKLGCK
ncbi:MAG: FHA domain-containing protein [Bradymonadaceae bacterium]